MTPLFVQSVHPIISYRQRNVANAPINIHRCLSLYKSRYNYYPDNEGIPSIVFQFSGKTPEKYWVYDNNDQRDAEFTKLMDLFGQKL